MIVVGDLHLTRHTPVAVGRDLARLLQRHAGETLALVGDFVDLSTDAPRQDRREALTAIFDVHQPAREALGRHLDRGGEVLLIGGNHDADLGQRGVETALLDALGVEGAARARLHRSPWFWRDRGLHLEHGHLYDPDNAPAHPLIVGESSLGVHFSAEFIHPTGAHRYLQKNDETPLRLFLSAFRWYGMRAPYVVYRYFHTAFAALAKAGPLYRGEREVAMGEERKARFAEEAGVPTSLVDAVFATRAASTLTSWPATFARMYLDRVLATLLVGGGLATAAGGKRAAGGSLATLGALLMTTSWVAGHNRYRGNVVEHLDRAAERIATTTGAELVVFGHTHREHLEPSYANTGAFAFPQNRDAGRPYVAIRWDGDRPVAERHYLTA